MWRCGDGFRRGEMAAFIARFMAWKEERRSCRRLPRNDDDADWKPIACNKL